MQRGGRVAMWVCGSVLAGGVQAAEPPANVSASAKVAPSAGPAPVASVRKPLDLRLGDLRKYMTPEEFRALSAPPDESNTVVVEANAPLLPMKSPLDVPGGIVAPFWALAHPTQAWRLFLPDARVDINKIPPPDNKVPPPVFRWGP